MELLQESHLLVPLPGETIHRPGSFATYWETIQNSWQPVRLMKSVIRWDSSIKVFTTIMAERLPNTIVEQAMRKQDGLLSWVLISTKTVLPGIPAPAPSVVIPFKVTWKPLRGVQTILACGPMITAMSRRELRLSIY